MKAARLHQFTHDPAAVCVEQVPLPEPGTGQVRVRMLFSPVNPSDLNFVHGTYHSALQRMIWNKGQATVCYDPQRRVVCPVPPYTLGGEGVGMVDACGSGFLARRLLGKRVAIACAPPAGCWLLAGVQPGRGEKISGTAGADFRPAGCHVLRQPAGSLCDGA